MIKVTNLSRSYGDFMAVKDISFEVGTGQILGLLGPNGAGKTTLMKILTGFHFPTSGKAEIGGFDVEEQTSQVQALVGYLPENAPLYPDLTVTEYLEFIAGVKDLPKDQIQAAITEALELCALTTVRFKVIGQLSKGFRQRVGLAQAILAKPKIIILDEPTNGLDPNQILEFRDLIRTIGRDKTVILSTHIMQEVEALCPQLLIMNEGRIVAQGSTQDIVQRFQGEEAVTLTVKGMKSQEALASLRKISGVQSIRLESEDANPVITLIMPQGSNASEKVFDWALENKVKLLSLVPQNLSLEDLFKKLTKESVL